MSENSVGYKCPSCGGTLVFEPKSGKLKCEYCDSMFTVEEVEKMYASANAKAEQAGAGSTDASGTILNNLKVYTCKSCGAELVAADEDISSTCPYCGNPTALSGTFKDSEKPACIIPFAFTKAEAEEKLKGYYKGKTLLPKSFSSNNAISEIKGVYVPFYLFSGVCSAKAEFRCERDYEEHGPKGEVRKHTETRYERRSGTESFSRVPVDASRSMPDDLMDSIEPYRYDDLRNFKYEYLLGFMAQKANVTDQECSGRAFSRMENTTVEELRQSVHGYDRVSEVNRSSSFNNVTREYALMPAWLLYTKWEGKDFLFGMNGQTSLMKGNLPIDKGKFILHMILTFIIAAVAAFGLSYLFFNEGGGPGEMAGQETIFVPLFIAVIVTVVRMFMLVGQMKPVKRGQDAGAYSRRRVR